MRPVGVVFQVQLQELLAAIDRDEQLRQLVLHVAHRARVIAGALVLDLDHGRAHVGQMLGRHRPRQKSGQVEDGDAGQWQVRSAVLVG